jgi:4-hydroxybenzoate polyprenyltransferase
LFLWEIARKVRAPDEETEYVTYTKRWGIRRVAVVLVISILTACVAMTTLGEHTGCSRGFLVLHCLGAVLAMGCVVAFWRHPNRAALRVRAPIEAYVALFYASTIVEALATRGTSWLF